MSIVTFIIQGTLLGAGVLVLGLILLYWLRWTNEKCRRRRRRDEINRDTSDDERENDIEVIEVGDTDSGMV